MSEITKFEEYKHKLVELCDNCGLTFNLILDRYPITLSIRRRDTMSAQLSLIEREKDVSTSDTVIIMAFVDGEMTFQVDDKIVISDALFTKFKNLFRNLYYTWLQHFFRDVMENEKLDETDVPQPPNDEDMGLNIPGAMIERLDDYLDEEDD